ncbi:MULTISPECIES: ribonuclease domain-containing protein [Micrococcaceae]|uniref:ribonuclease domain-containing protein n=1 Tax=Micrococcaceae TaxID=1268 RepID=UPI002AA670C8|nr:ribonuclease domain-containing protein [Pseudarthrobacter oxydans]WPU10139.1 ribonuclease domain-containing protein [Pseudarthrobacter oxydans]HET7784271.1 ribonuclease domain-containing protein [Arthrobacter sp.]
MRNRSVLPLLLAGLMVLAFLAFGGTGFLGQLTETTTPEGTSSAMPAPGAGPGTSAPGQDNPSGLPEVRESALPVEGRRVLELIRAGGPYRYSQDGQAFGNFERLLPRRDRGYYREYTVPTPGESDRGARRIVAGADGEKYYTDDHYESFRYIAEGS